jgi:sirohydrochlorin cobaltochelatase
MSAAEQQRGTILLAHGSRDPLWRQPMEAVAERIRQLAPAIEVRCAYLEITAPDLASCTAELVQLGVRFITIVPMFLGIGKHARNDLPVLLASLKASHPQVEFQLRDAIGEEVQMIELMARIALS